MASLDATNITKRIEIIHPNHLPDASPDDVANGFTALVTFSSENPNVEYHIHAPFHKIPNILWVDKLIPGLEKLAAKYHCGNFVIVRGTTEPFFESMPLYVRIGMHLLFYGAVQIKILGTQTVNDLLREESIRQGEIYDNPKSVHSIPSFIKTYSIQTNELLEPDITKYKNFNDFFSRKLKPDARPVQNEKDDAVICSAADSRLTVYASFDLARAFWIKGRNFKIPNLLNLPPKSSKVKVFQNASLVIFRLAPSDYHRFHCPIDCEVGEVEHVEGRYYTVNPQAVNEPGFDVFTLNTRSILYLKHLATGKLVAFVAIGALLVGSIRWTGGARKGAILKRGDELGYERFKNWTCAAIHYIARHFLYGGSTIVIVFPTGVIEFDQDLVSNSEKPIETLVKVGYSIGKVPRQSHKQQDSELDEKKLHTRFKFF